MNEHIERRLKAIQQALLAHYQGGSGLPNALIGGEREHLVNDYLSQLLPPIYRFGRGAVTDAAGEISGQLEVVMELPLGSNFPMPAGTERLYLAESVAAVIEVKSNLSSQWSEVKRRLRKSRYSVEIFVKAPEYYWNRRQIQSLRLVQRSLVMRSVIMDTSRLRHFKIDWTQRRLSHSRTVY